jgi:hypothetical protein
VLESTQSNREVGKRGETKDELKRLRREMTQLKQEREVLKSPKALVSRICPTRDMRAMPSGAFRSAIPTMIELFGDFRDMSVNSARADSIAHSAIVDQIGGRLEGHATCLAGVEAARV